MISPGQAALLIGIADRAAAGLCRHARACHLDQEDVRQDLLLDLLMRLRSFDPSRSSLPTFAMICFQHRATRLRLATKRDRLARHPVALDAPPPGRPAVTLIDTLAEADGYAAWIGQPTDGFAQLERQLDLDRALSALPQEALSICTALIESDTNPANAAGLSRTTMHRRVHDLRCRLLAAGIAGPVELTARQLGTN